MQRVLIFSLLCVVLPWTAQATEEPKPLPRFYDQIEVLDDLALVQPVAAGQSVRIAFGVGELEIEANDAAEIRTDLRVDCKELDDERCAKYAKRLKLEPSVKNGVVEVKLSGLRRSRLRKLSLEGRITVPRWAPLTVRMGVGEVTIRAGDKDLAVDMGIGVLAVRAPKDAVGHVAMGTRIGDVSLRGGGTRAEARRRMLVGATLEWAEGEGDASIDVGLRIGEVEVVLE